MTTKTIQLDIKNKIAFITLHRPEVRNAFNEVLIEELIQAFNHVAQDPSCRVIILKGAGKVFSAGGDLEWMKKSATFTPEQNVNDARRLSYLLQTILSQPQPVIGQIHGAALGGGMGLVSVCDYVLAETQTLFGFTEVQLGLIPAVIGPFVLNKIGISQARALFLTAQKFNTQRAYELGLVHQQIAPEQNLESETLQVAEQILTNSPEAVRRAKKYLLDITSMSFNQQHEYAAQTLAEVRSSSDAREGIQAFLEKRKPGWK